jgi:hypothetical protein
VTVTDANSCVSVTDCAGITINLVLDCSITTDNPVCAGTTHPASVGSAGAGATYAWTVTGGTLNSGQNTNSISYTAGTGPTVTIDITVTDINNCTNTCQRVVTVNSNPTANAGADIARCADAADPTVGGAPTGSGGTGPYTYLWTGTGAAYLSSTTVANPTFGVSVAGPGSYQACVTVTDANSCVGATDCATVTIRALPVANAGIDRTLCADAVDPTVGGSPTGSGGTGPYTYLWSGTGAAFLSSTTAANPTFDVSVAGPGSYQVCVTVTDANLCVSAIDCATITINALPVANAGNDITLCADAANPTVGGSPTGSSGTGPYTYLWTGTGAAYLSSTTVANPTFNVATAGPGTRTVCVTVTDANLCVSTTDCATVIINALPSCTITAENLVCWGTAGHTASAPGGAVSYSWGITGGTINSGQGTTSISYTAGAGPNLTLTVTVTDANGCVNTCQKVVTVDHPDCTISANDSVCYLSTGNLATAPASMSSYVWTVTGGTLTSQIGNSITYTAGSGTSLTLQVTVTNANGCVSTCQKLVTIIQPSLNATMQLEAVSNVVTRDVTFVFTDCSGGTDTRTVPVTTNASGIGSVTINSLSAGMDWVSVREGHTLLRLQAISYGACYVATINLTTAGSGRPLVAGDFRTAVVTQDNLVDITDFSILASRWNQTIDRNLGTGADATGDGAQNTADFTAIQVNFFDVGEEAEGCPKVATDDDDGLRTPEAEPVPVVTPRSSVPVSSLGFASANKADLNGDGMIDTKDIRAFARQNGLTLLPEFSEKLDKLETSKPRSPHRR